MQLDPAESHPFYAQSENTEAAPAEQTSPVNTDAAPAAAADEA